MGALRVRPSPGSGRSATIAGSKATPWPNAWPSSSLASATRPLRPPSPPAPGIRYEALHSMHSWQHAAAKDRNNKQRDRDAPSCYARMTVSCERTDAVLER
jgi:hypothetical protein